MAPAPPDLREAGGGGVTTTRRQATLGRKKKKHLQNFSALRALGGDIEIFKRTLLGGDLDEKIDFRRVTSRAP